MSDPRNDFVVVLPSNSNLASHPHNRPDRYTVRLHQPVSLVGDWEAALLNIYFPQNWYDFKETVTLHWISSTKQVSFSDEVIAQSKIFVNQHPADQRQTVVVLKDIPGNFDDDFSYGKITIRPGRYSNVQQIGNEVADMLTTQINNKKPFEQPTTKIQYSYNVETRTGAFYNREQIHLYLFASSPYLSNVVGCQNLEVNYTHAGVISRPNFGKLYMISGPKRSTFEKIDTILIYSDIVEHQAVGDVEAPLLGIVPVITQKEEKTFFTFNPPIYLPVIKTHFSEVQVLLRTSQGGPIPFPEHTPNVMTTLRFRRRRNLF